MEKNLYRIGVKMRLENQLRVLRDIEKTYPTSSIGNIIMQIESRIKNMKE